VRSLALLAIAAIVLCPTQPRAEEPQAAASPTAPAAAAPATAPATPANSQVPAPTGDANNAKPAVAAATAKTDEYKPPNGYRKEKRDGVVVYCRRDVESGSRFSKKICLTREDLEYLVEAQKNASDSLIRAARVCSNPGTCANP
jgi:hypothetical protein